MLSREAAIEAAKEAAKKVRRKKKRTASSTSLASNTFQVKLKELVYTCTVICHRSCTG